MVSSHSTSQVKDCYYWHGKVIFSIVIYFVMFEFSVLQRPYFIHLSKKKINIKALYIYTQ